MRPSDRGVVSYAWRDIHFFGFQFYVAGQPGAVFARNIVTMPLTMRVSGTSSRAVRVPWMSSCSFLTTLLDLPPSAVLFAIAVLLLGKSLANDVRGQQVPAKRFSRIILKEDRPTRACDRSLVII